MIRIRSIVPLDSERRYSGRGARMNFFDEHGNVIQCRQWLSTYEPHYFLNGPKTQIKNQTSRLVEDRVCALLKKKSPLSEEDLKLSMAWKVDAIDHKSSETSGNIKYRYNWGQR